jgi:hypothetical protein
MLGAMIIFAFGLSVVIERVERKINVGDHLFSRKRNEQKEMAPVKDAEK